MLNIRWLLGVGHLLDAHVIKYDFGLLSTSWLLATCYKVAMSSCV